MTTQRRTSVADAQRREAYLRRVVNAVPPMSTQQRERITALLSDRRPPCACGSRHPIAS